MFTSCCTDSAIAEISESALQTSTMLPYITRQMEWSRLLVSLQLCDKRTCHALVSPCHPLSYQQLSRSQNPFARGLRMHHDAYRDRRFSLAFIRLG